MSAVIRTSCCVACCGLLLSSCVIVSDDGDADCDPRIEKVCQDDGLHWVDSCGEVEAEVADACACGCAEDGVGCAACACEPTTCAAEGASCGTLPDGCDDTLDCGSCTAPETCGGDHSCGLAGPAFVIEGSNPISGASGVDLNGIWGVAAGWQVDLWIVGDAGTVVRWVSGDGWEQLDSPSDFDLTRVFGSSSSDWFITGAYTMLFWDSATGFNDDWQQSFAWRGVWGQVSTHVYAIQDVFGMEAQCGVNLWRGVVDGWTHSGTFTPSCMALGGAGDYAWIGTTGGVQYNIWLSQGGDQGWNAQTSDSVGFFTDVWALDEDHAWMSGTEGLIALDSHFDVWNRVTALTRPGNEALHGVWASSADDLWVVGEDGFIAHFDGSAWVEIPNPVRGQGVALNDIWGWDAENILIVGDGGTVLIYAQP